jgi:tetratricopeptide (TPR) repeat protein
MTVSEYIERISELWPDSEQNISPEILALSTEAVEAFPEAPELWCLRGHLIELAPEDYPVGIAEAGNCYRKATELDPEYADAWESLGYYLDNYDEDIDEADEAFRKAIETGGDGDSYIGLARVLAQKGQKMAALKILSPGECPYADEQEVQDMRDEIQEGLWSPE